MNRFFPTTQRMLSNGFRSISVPNAVSCLAAETAQAGFWTAPERLQNWRMTVGFSYFSGFYSTTPRSWDFIMEACNFLLALYLLFNLLMAMAFLIPVDAEYKMFFTKIQYAVLRPIHDMHFLLPCANLVLTAWTLIVFAETWYQNSKSTCYLCMSRGFPPGGALLCSLLVQGWADRLITLGLERFLELELEVQRAQIRTFQPPSKRVLRLLLGPLKHLIGVDAVGLEHINPELPTLFVANHQLHGLDVPILLYELYESASIFVRGLADHFHCGIPIHSHILRWMGAVDGTRPNADCLMAHGQHLLVYPGGGREVMRHSSSPKYTLQWKGRLGFARMAIKHAYPIQPIASIGIDEMVDIIADIPLGCYRKQLTFPVVGPLWPHRLQKIYIWIGRAIPTKQYNGDWKNDALVREVRNNTKAAIEAGIQMLLEQQNKDQHRHHFPKINKFITSLEERCKKDQ